MIINVLYNQLIFYFRLTQLLTFFAFPSVLTCFKFMLASDLKIISTASNIFQCKIGCVEVTTVTNLYVPVHLASEIKTGMQIIAYI